MQMQMRMESSRQLSTAMQRGAPSVSTRQALGSLSRQGCHVRQTKSSIRPTSSLSVNSRRLPHCRPVQAAAAASSPGDVPSSSSSSGGGGGLAAFKIFQPLSDPKLNFKLIALAIGQMLCSIATLIHDSYLPVYVHDELGLSTTSIGGIQGMAQFLCQISKGVSGVAGDVLGSQPRVLVFGVFLTFLCKPMFVLLSTVYGVFGMTACIYWFFFAKLFDRVSKGIREAPSKAVMNELARESGDSPDAAYGLRQSLSTGGMLLGSTIASLTFAATGHNYVATFSVAMVFPLLALIWMLQCFREEIFGAPKTKTVVVTPTPPDGGAPLAPPTPVAVSVSTAEGGTVVVGDATSEPPLVLNLWQKAQLLVGAFKPVYWQALAVVAVLYLARFDASFLSLRAKQVMPKAGLPMLTLINSMIQMFLTAPLAALAGQSVKQRNILLLIGFVFMIGADACFGLECFASAQGMFLGAALLGVHMALTHSITVSMIASYQPTGEVRGLGKLTGTAVSFTDLLLGFVLASSNTLAGVLADFTRKQGLGNTGCFAGGATACVLAGVLLLLFSRFGDLGRDDLIVKREKKKRA